MQKGSIMGSISNIKTYESLAETETADDGYVGIDYSLLGNNDFKTEKDLSDYINDNIKTFCTEICDDVYIAHEVDKPFHYKGKRVDLFIECEKSLFVIELKNPRHMPANVQAIGQILDYGRRINGIKKMQLIIITTKFCIDTAQTIKHYHLPIRYMYFSRNQCFEYIGGI